MKWGPASVVAVVLAAACWQPPDLPPVEQPPFPDLLAQRPYKLELPLDEDGGTRLAPDAGWPLLVLLHGYASTGVETRAYLGLDSADLRARFAMVLPHGLRSPADAPQAWHPQVPAKPPWDSAYIRAVVSDILAKGTVDPSRVYVVGFSQGGHMAHRFACDSADLVTAVVSIAGQLITCEPSRPVSALEIHGTQDHVIPAAGAPITAGAWATADGCGSPAARTGRTFDLTDADGGETYEVAWPGCPAGTDVALWWMQDEGHDPTWTGLAPALTDFFEAHRH